MTTDTRGKLGLAIDDGLRRRMKSAAALQGMTLTSAWVEAAEAWLSDPDVAIAIRGEETGYPILRDML